MERLNEIAAELEEIAKPYCGVKAESLNLSHKYVALELEAMAEKLRLCAIYLPDMPKDK